MPIVNHQFVESQHTCVQVSNLMTPIANRHSSPSVIAIAIKPRRNPLAVHQQKKQAATVP